MRVSYNYVSKFKTVRGKGARLEVGGAAPSSLNPQSPLLGPTMYDVRRIVGFLISVSKSHSLSAHLSVFSTPFPHAKHTAHKEDFRKGILVPLQQNSVSQPLHVCSKSDQSDCFFWSSYECGPIRLFVLIMFVAFRVTQAGIVNKRYVSVWSYVQKEFASSLKLRLCLSGDPEKLKFELPSGFALTV